MEDLREKTAIVTGAGRGIGERLATALAESGANVVAAARTESEIDVVASRLESTYDVEAVAVPTDVSQVSDVEALYESTVETFGTPEILVNNAGVNVVKPLSRLSEEEIDAMLEVNVKGTFLTSQRFGTVFRDSALESGRIINVGSIVADIGVPAMTVYSGMKAAI